jgi:hypothetical protein
MNLFQFLWVIFALLDPDTDPGTPLNPDTDPGTPLNPDLTRIWIYKAFNRGDERKGHLITWRELLLLFSSEKEQIWHTSSARCQ